MRLIPQSLFARLSLILVAGLLAAQAASLLIHGDERQALIEQFDFERELSGIAAAVARLDATAPAERAAVERALRAAGLELRLLDIPPPSGGWAPPPLRQALNAGLGSDRLWQLSRPPGAMRGGGGMGAMGSMHGPLTLDVALAGGGGARFALAPQPLHRPPPSHTLLTSLGLSLAMVILVSLLAVSWATRPLRRLAEAANGLAGDLDQPPLAETGPAEARAAAVAFNRMQATLARLIAERTRALSAMSHDLRTPLTRLRLRSEMLNDASLRAHIQGDLDEMQNMVEGTLDYLRGLQDTETPRPLDINALVHSLAEDFAAAGKPGTVVEGQADSPYPARASALRRALSNLVDNALKYAGAASIGIEDTAGMLRIVVADRGPGIPAQALARVQQPFQRLEPARSRDGGGVGLGLAIASDIAAMHGGRLHLSNRTGGGLCAALELPRTGAVPDPGGRP